VLLALVGLVANLGYSITPDTSWTQTQLTNYVDAQRYLSDITGHPLQYTVVQGDNFPRPAASGTLFIKGNCQDLYVALETVPKVPTALTSNSFAWKLIERAPHTPLCHSLLGGVRTGSGHDGA
jgi:hypothetical protein